MKKVMFICEYAALYSGNFISSLLELDSKIELRQYECIYVFPLRCKDRAWMGEFRKLNKKVFFYDLDNLFVGYDLVKLVKKENVKIVHLHFARISLAVVLRWFSKCEKVVWHLHSDFSMGRIKKDIKSFIKYNLIGKKIIIVSVSKQIAEMMDNVKYLANGIAMKRFDNEEINIKETRTQLGIKESEKFILAFGWSPQVKGVDIAIKAIKRLNRENNMYKLGIVCGNKYTIDVMKKYIENELEENLNNIILLNPIENVFKYHECADVLLSASRSEGFSYAILEALCIGKKCVISDIPGVQWACKYELVELFASENSEECANAIIRILRKEVDSKAVSNKVKEDYSIDKWTEEIVENIYEI